MASQRYDALADSPMAENRPTRETAKLAVARLPRQANEGSRGVDGSTVLHLAPQAPAGKDANWLRTVPGKGYFAIFRLYAPTEAALDKSWKPGDIEKARLIRHPQTPMGIPEAQPVTESFPERRSL